MQETKQLINDLRRVPNELERKVNKEAQELALKGKIVAEEASPVDSGTLRDSWEYKQTRKGNITNHMVYNDTEYAINQELGGVTPTGGVYSGNHMVDKGAKEVETLIEKSVDNITQYIMGGVLRGK